MSLQTARPVQALHSTIPRLVISIAPNPIKFTGFGDTHGPQTYKFTGFGDIHGPKPYKCRGLQAQTCTGEPTHTNTHTHTHTHHTQTNRHKHTRACTHTQTQTAGDSANHTSIPNRHGAHPPPYGSTDRRRGRPGNSPATEPGQRSNGPSKTPAQTDQPKKCKKLPHAMTRMGRGRLLYAPLSKGPGTSQPDTRQAEPSYENAPGGHLLGPSRWPTWPLLLPGRRKASTRTTGEVRAEGRSGPTEPAALQGMPLTCLLLGRRSAMAATALPCALAASTRSCPLAACLAGHLGIPRAAGGDGGQNVFRAPPDRGISVATLCPPSGGLKPRCLGHAPYAKLDLSRRHTFVRSERPEV
jgi:hypothetical protein